MYGTPAMSRYALVMSQNGCHRILTATVMLHNGLVTGSRRGSSGGTGTGSSRRGYFPGQMSLPAGENREYQDNPPTLIFPWLPLPLFPCYRLPVLYILVYDTFLLQATSSSSNEEVHIPKEEIESHPQCLRDSF